MNSIRVLSVALLSTANWACSGGGGNSSSDDPDTRLSTVQVALTAPTGNVTATTAKAILADWQSFQRVRPAFDSILLLGTDTAKSCLDGSKDAGTYDLNCLTLGKWRGRLTFQSRGPVTDAGLQGSVSVKLEDACLGDACVTADASLEITPSNDCAALATLAVSATVSRAGASESIAFGAQGGIGRGQLMARVVYFDADDRSFVVAGDGGLGATGPYLVTGANGSFECSFLADGGRCDGPTTFVF